jgi:uncharacterized membrane protein
MKTIVEFLKTTLLGGMFVLLPVSLLYILVLEIFEIAVAVATPITLLFPAGQFDDNKFPELLAILLIVGASLIIGLLMRSNIGVRVGEWIESKILYPVPGYEFLKSLINSLGNTRKARGFRPALKKLPGGGYQTAYVVENPGNGWMTILLPHSPAAMAGPVELVPADQVEILETGFGNFMQTLNHWGIGVQELTPPSIAPSISKQP